MHLISKLTLAFLITMLTNPINVNAQNFFVTNVGEFDVAVEQVEPGGKIVLANGVWDDVHIGFFANGVEGDSITIMAETPGEVIFTGTSKIELAGNYLIVKDLDFNEGYSSGDAVISFRRNSNDVANHSRVTNCRIINYNPETDATEYKWVSLYGEHNRVDHSHFEGKNHEGALLVVWLSGSANHHRIDHNYFANIPELGRNGAETIRIGTSDNSMTESRTTVEYNMFESCDGEIEIVSNKSGFNVYRYNTFRDNEGTLTLRHGNDCEVYGNFFFGGDKSSGGVRIIGERHKVYNNYFQGLKGDGFRAAICMTNGVPDSPLNRYFQVKNAEVVHNTIVNCKEPIAIGEGKSDELSLPPINSTIANNLIDKTIGGKAITYTDTPINMEYLSNYINGTVGISATGIINEDPLIVEEEVIFRPASESPVINNATGNFEYVIQDIDGQNRDNSPDVGCDEKSSLTIVNKPLFKEDVGFDWSVDDSITSIEESSQSNIFISSNRNEVIVHGISYEQFPVRLMLYDTTGKRVYDNQVSGDTVRVEDYKGVLIAIILDGSNQILAKSKVILSHQ
ncbi:polysaccharide lyase 6 family protein [Fulvivirga lutimaris]|uniref:polysaccharide lyase 6 family protein n=1 Tax=Fulvivirga lutimaris TaxID=1819566 RepID=UPI0012BD47CE|nr:polysaccharide lyase 6 family protein [Fulvivirga lutimaris]MTI40097.1 alginate lyase [Fulvivirga lutimaris]